MSDPVGSPVRNLESTLLLGSLLVAAGLLFHGIYGLSGEWPARLGGWGGTLFVALGAVFLGASLVSRVRSRRAVRE